MDWVSPVVTVVLAAATAIGGQLIFISRLTSRVAVVEAQLAENTAGIKQRLDRLEAKVDTLIMRSTDA